jgi:Cys-rich repeat protein
MWWIILAGATLIFLSLLGYWLYNKKDASVSYRTASDCGCAANTTCKDAGGNTFFSDPRCADAGSDPFGGLGCGVGGTQTCRFCGFSPYQNITCPAGPPGCKSDSDCGPNFTCQNGACVPKPPPVQCRQDSDCKTGEICRNGICVPYVPPPQCVACDKCPAGQTCTDAGGNTFATDCGCADPTTDKWGGKGCNAFGSPNCRYCGMGNYAEIPCPKSPSGCKSDSDCGPNFTCKNGACVPKPPPVQCRQDSDCSMLQVCDNGKCINPFPEGCKTNANCPKGQVCLAGKCVQGGCRTDQECPSGFVCVDGVCIRPLPPGGCAKDSDCPSGMKCFDGACSYDDSTPGQTSDFRVTNRTNATLWIEARQGANSLALPGYTSPIRLAAGASLDFDIPAGGLIGTRFWAKWNCDEQGRNCEIGDQDKYLSDNACPTTGCTPPIDTLFEASFGCRPGASCVTNPSDGTPQGPKTYFDTSAVDGFTLPYKLYIKGDLKKCIRQCSPGETCKQVVSVIDGSRLDLRQCPANEDLSIGGAYPHVTDDSLSPPKTYDLQSVDLRFYDSSRKNILGCISPCKKLNYGQPLGYRQSESVKPTEMFCCPTNVPMGQPVNEDTCKEASGCMTPARCKAGPIVNTKYVAAIHSMAPNVYAFSYDDQNGLMACDRDVKYELVFCPRGSAQYPMPV